MRQPGRLKHIARLGALITLLATMLVLATTSSAQAEEQIDSFNAEVVVRPNGDLDVRETIAWDFGGASNKHGIFRFVPRLHLWTLDQRPGWKSWQKFYRLTPITFLDASSPTGANTDQFVERKGSNEVLRLGRKNREVFGLQTYNIHYVVGRAVVNNELRYAVTGRGWVVSARSIRAHISVAIAARGRPRCEVDGTVGPHCVLTVNGDSIDVVADSLGAEVVVPLDPARVSSPEPVFRQRQSLRRAFDWTNGQAILAGLVAVLAGVLLTLAGRRGRDRMYGSGAAFEGPGAPERPRRLGEKLAEPVEFAPPEGIAPGMIGSIRKGTVDHVALSATLVDLAVRGHVHIASVDTDSNGPQKADHELTIPPAHAKRRGGLRDYEEKLIATLFAGKTRVKLSELKKDRTLYKGLAKVRDSIQNEVVSTGYWEERPDRVRAKWVLLGMFVLIAGVVGTIVLGTRSDKALLGLPVIVLGLGLLVISQVMPVRTATGTRLRARLDGFEELFDAGEGERIAATEGRDIFSEYLPYAMAFGNVKQWVNRCASLGTVPATAGWYTSPAGMGLDPGRFDSVMRDFEKSLAGAMSAAAASPNSSGGGGGGGSSSGGGGGGSW